MIDDAETIAELLADYRAGEIPVPTATHVRRWVDQFPVASRVEMLRELAHVWGETYYSRASVFSFLSGLLQNTTVAGDDPSSFWKSVTFLDIQESGASQTDLLELLDGELDKAFNYRMADCGAPGERFLYLDDGIYSGSRAGNDLEMWIAEAAPSHGSVDVVCIAGHTLGEYFLKTRLRRVAQESGKELEFRFLATRWFESRKSFRNRAEVLWPCEVPADPHVEAYVAGGQTYPLVPRAPGGPLGPFLSEEGRQLLEREFVIAGVEILRNYANPSAILRPLGFSPFGLGFGSLVMTYRNCPNNAPLALWWGLDDGSWYPLLPRKTY